ncbi:MAG: PilZ domain-containing protein [Proteobacteria bacterium]|nr:PilZ domain-containing protein [Pseudomonadota bacterium]
MSDENEKRRFTRVPFKVKVEMTVNKVLYWADGIDNLSVGGCLLPVEADLETGTTCHLKILLSGTNSELSVQVDGEIIRCESGAVAVKFVQIEPDSLFHLRNIVRYNYPDSEKVEQEISKHPGLL